MSHLSAGLAIPPVIGTSCQGYDARDNQAGDRSHKDQQIIHGLSLLKIILATKCRAIDATKQLPLPIANVCPSVMVPE